MGTATRCFGAISLRDGAATLFVPRQPDEYAVWMGAPPTLEEVRATYKVCGRPTLPLAQSLSHTLISFFLAVYTLSLTHTLISFSLAVYTHSLSLTHTHSSRSLSHTHSLSLTRLVPSRTHTRLVLSCTQRQQQQQPHNARPLPRAGGPRHVRRRAPRVPRRRLTEQWLQEQWLQGAAPPPLRGPQHRLRRGRRGPVQQSSHSVG